MNKPLIDSIKKNHPDITLVMASKYLEASDFKPYLDAGIRDFGESRVSSLIEKVNALQGEPITWHFLGTLQSKKVKKMIDKIDCLHSLDRLSVAREIEKRRNRPLSCLIQVNISGEENKHGVSPKQLSTFIESLEPFRKIEIIGLMGIAKRSNDDSVIKKQFALLQSLRDETAKTLPSCTELSMGMSEDYQIAIEEGATMLRLGRILIKEGML